MRSRNVFFLLLFIYYYYFFFFGGGVLRGVRSVNQSIFREFSEHGIYTCKYKCFYFECLQTSNLSRGHDIIGEHSTKTTMAVGTEKSLFNYLACI